jgi:Nitrous oxide-stimulated promoter
LTCVKARAEPLRHADSVKTKNDLAQARLTREWRTMTAMVEIFCRDHHRPARDLCAECRIFLEYANLRLERCHFGAAKPVCAKCPVHCYQRERREQVRVIMRYAGPKMLWEHPVLGLRHWLDGFRKAPSI